MRTDRQTVFDRVRDFPSWGDWSPWLLHEPDAKRHFSAAADQPDGYYTWDGRAIGAGRLTQVRFEEPKRIEQRLEIQRPFKSGSDVWWEFTEADGGTEVAWCLRGRMPFLLRPMIPMVREMIGSVARRRAQWSALQRLPQGRHQEKDLPVRHRVTGAGRDRPRPL
ncbi:MAG TPA: SRPBCC family protein, partial [Lamprocystis sp. (in: g-proteobacteria)]|nr:SRPBCC family protein [Lamprocystis sp. (in: g-proteobacteria)]